MRKVEAAAPARRHDSRLGAAARSHNVNAHQYTFSGLDVLGLVLVVLMFALFVLAEGGLK